MNEKKGDDLEESALQTKRTASANARWQECMWLFPTQEGAVALNYKAWQRGAIGVEEHHLHRKQCDWCPLELCHESAHARTLAWLE